MMPYRRHPSEEAAKWNELVYTGWQASLPKDNREGGFVDKEANKQYSQASPERQRTCESIARCLRGLMVQTTVDYRIPVGPEMYRLGEQFVYNGYVQGVYGNPDGEYDITDPEEGRRLKAVQAHLQDQAGHEAFARQWNPDYKIGQSIIIPAENAYMEHTTPKLRQSYANMVNLGVLALNRIDIIASPWCLEPYGQSYPGQNHWKDYPGMQEGIMRGEGAIHRVSEVVGYITELQEALVTPRPTYSQA